MIVSDINRGAVTICITPHWRRRRLCGDSRTHPTINNRGAVADSAIFARKYRRITWRGWCWAYGNTPLQATLREVIRPTCYVLLGGIGLAIIFRGAWGLDAKVEQIISIFAVEEQRHEDNLVVVEVFDKI